MRFVGIDPGTYCGYAFTDTDEVEIHQSGVWNLQPSRHEGGGMRYLRLENYLAQVLGGHIGNAALFYEEVRGHKGTDAAQVYGGIIATITRVCETHQVPYMGIPVGTIKKRATGKGNCSKEAMIEATSQFWKGRVMFSDMSAMPSDQADALWVLQCGLDELTIPAAPSPPPERSDPRAPGPTGIPVLVSRSSGTRDAG